MLRPAATTVGSIAHFAEKFFGTNLDIFLLGETDQFLQPGFMLVASHTVAHRKPLSLKGAPL